MTFFKALGHYIIQKKEEEQEEKKKEGEKREKKENKKMYDKEENEDTKKTIITPLPLFFLPRLASLLQHLVEFILHSLSSTSPLGSGMYLTYLFYVLIYCLIFRQTILSNQTYIHHYYYYTNTSLLREIAKEINS